MRLVEGATAIVALMQAVLVLIVIRAIAGIRAITVGMYMDVSGKLMQKRTLLQNFKAFQLVIQSL